VVTTRIALISETPEVPFGRIAEVSAAVQKQVADDFRPAWGIDATVDPFPALTSVPVGYWPVVVRDDIGVNQAGVHLNDTADKPFALVTFRTGWPLSVSHEVLEMLADPLGTVFLPGPSVMPGQGVVEYLVEVCDPCQAAGFGYRVNEETLADFVLPSYYTSFVAGQHSFKGHVTEPRQVLTGGYVTWRDPATGSWTQFSVSTSGTRFRDLGQNPAPADVHLRGVIDREANVYLEKAAKQKRRAGTRPARLATAATADSSAARRGEADRWRKLIDRIVTPTRPNP
jgi:hypothetical protein